MADLVIETIAKGSKQYIVRIFASADTAKAHGMTFSYEFSSAFSKATARVNGIPVKHSTGWHGPKFAFPFVLNGVNHQFEVKIKGNGKVFDARIDAVSIYADGVLVQEERF